MCFLLGTWSVVYKEILSILKNPVNPVGNLSLQQHIPPPRPQRHCLRPARRPQLRQDLAAIFILVDDDVVAVRRRGPEGVDAAGADQLAVDNLVFRDVARSMKGGMTFEDAKNWALSANRGWNNCAGVYITKKCYQKIAWKN